MKSFDWNASFEFLAARFYRETGLMAPGKDDLFRSSAEDDQKEPHAKWGVFMNNISAEAYSLWHERFGDKSISIFNEDDQ